MEAFLESIYRCNFTDMAKGVAEGMTDVLSGKYYPHTFPCSVCGGVSMYTVSLAHENVWFLLLVYVSVNVYTVCLTFENAWFFL